MDPKTENQKVSVQLSTVLRELERLKSEKRGRFNEKSRERDERRSIDRGRSSSVDRIQRSGNGNGKEKEHGNGNSNGNSNKGRESDYDFDEENESDSYDDRSGNQNNSSSEKKRSRDTRRISKTSYSYRNHENERGRERGSEDETKVAVQAMKRELSNIREDIQRQSSTKSTPVITPTNVPFGGHFTDVGSLEREVIRLQGITGNLRKELELSERSFQTANRKINDNVEEIRYKNDEIVRLKDFLENAKSDNKRIIRELRIVKDENEYDGVRGKYDYTTVSRLEVEKLKMEASSLHEKIDSLLKNQQKVSYTHRLEIESKKSEIDQLTSQIAVLVIQNKVSGSVDSSSYQV